MRRTTLLFVVLSLLLAAGCEPRRGRSGGGSGGGGSTGTALNGGVDPGTGSVSPDGWCPTNTLVADLGGLPGTATLDYELGLQWVFVTGRIVSQTAEYLFGTCELPRDDYTGEIVADVCWADVTETSTGEGFLAELEFYPTGFLFTPNPFGDAPTTTYDFVCQ